MTPSTTYHYRNASGACLVREGFRTSRGLRLVVELGAANSLLEWARVRVSEKDACDEQRVLMLMVLMVLIATTIEMTKRRAEYRSMKSQSMVIGVGIICL